MKTILNYKKPAFWITVAAIVVCIIIAVCFLTKPAKEYQIRITIPAGSTEAICYSDEEICPNGSTLTLENGDGLGDTEVVLLPVEYREKNTYEPTYMTSGMPVKIDVEKGAWFKIGVNMQNPTADDINVYVSAKDVEVRIADSDSIAEMGEESLEKKSEWITEEINVEKRDITHDGILDYIVTSMYYDTSYIDSDATLMEKITEQIMYDIVTVTVYEGLKDTDTYSERNKLWSYDYSRVHAGNGQLSIVEIDGKDYLLTSNLYGGQGIAAWNYELFSLSQTGEKKVIDEKAIDFEIGRGNASEHYKELQSSISRYIENGILIVACDIDFEQQLIRTPDTPYIPQNYYDSAFTKYDDEESTYATGGTSELEAKQDVVSEEEAVEIVRMQLIQAYENRYGTFEASDIQPTIYSGDEERLAYIIPRLAVSEITEDFYVIPVIWDFRVYKDTGKVTVYYNGIDPFEYEFDPNNPQHLTFAG